MSNTRTVPPGYKADGQGRLTPLDAIKPIDLLRDDLVVKIAERAREESQRLAEFKGHAFNDIAAFVDLSAEQYGVSLGGRKGNLTLYSFDQRYKLIRAMDETLVFDERLQVAKALIDQCLADWTADARPELKAIIDRAFEVDKAGNINTDRVLALRRIQSTDERWAQAMQAISDSTMPAGSKSYIRVYERVGLTDRYEQIPLGVANV
ncbi:DUF3164 family protein [Bordetella pseudohinzii]|uniref:Protein of uncharacterized function (DUF3164) n=1 Tax=Bordetella pseudohinzii TaxID=1331258 RepID=A0A0J6C2A6_9BORD|nr:DUF3164 family protein [Bordetella pseudohinzii]ANY15929.1 sulfate transporter [Bordetella pseudohinzii]KMM25168.1 sulfate transporter [Bordetella pseudohinzii]KXA75913.1 sulfate transporter [Bordetella pseudohinzii]KXA78965.1 sulfate transporter [Bordetella pseudohinzii]CUI46071.1 Protein of uncharacterised function (DUF3164) [Bordetella pseudohinzii]